MTLRRYKIESHYAGGWALYNDIGLRSTGKTVQELVDCLGGGVFLEILSNNDQEIISLYAQMILQRIKLAEEAMRMKCVEIAESFIPSSPSPIGPLFGAGIAAAARGIADRIKGMEADGGKLPPTPGRD